MHNTDKKRTNVIVITAVLIVIAVIVVLFVMQNYGGSNPPQNPGEQVTAPQTTVGTLNPGSAE